MPSILDLPDNIFFTVLSFLKNDQKIATLRLVCHHFNHFTSESLFNTIALYAVPEKLSNDPADWLPISKWPRAVTHDYSRLSHQLDTLDPRCLPTLSPNLFPILGPPGLLPILDRNRLPARDCSRFPTLDHSHLPALDHDRLSTPDYNPLPTFNHNLLIHDHGRPPNAHIALRRSKHLKVFVSDLFRLHNPVARLPSLIQSSWQRDIHRKIQRLVLTLPTIIKALENLRETTLYISSYDPDEFIRDMSNALLVLPDMATLNLNFLDHKPARVLPIASSRRLESVRIYWLTGEPDPWPHPSSTGARGTSIYRTVMGAGSHLKRLELKAKRRWPVHSGMDKLIVLPQLEELTLENVPVQLDGDVAAQMTNLHTLRLAGYQCSNCDPYAGIFTSLKSVGRKLRVVGVDVVGEAFVDYLASYGGLETLVLELKKDANDYCVKDLCDNGFRYHEQSLRLLHIDLHPSSDFRLTWFFEYWLRWIPIFQNLTTLKVTTSMNLHSGFDAEILIKGALDTVAQMPSLSRVIIRHMHEEDPKAADIVFGDHAINYPPMALVKPVHVAPSCLVILQNFQKLYCVVLDPGKGGYGSLRLMPYEEQSLGRHN